MPFTSRMSVVSMLWLSLLSAGKVFAALSFPAPPHGYSNQFHEVNHFSTLANIAGNCRGHFPAIDTAWQEMLSMIDAGRGAARKIAETQEEPIYSDDPNALKEYKNWLRITQPFHALYDVASLAELRWRAQKVIKVYDHLMTRNRVTTPQGPRFWVVCNDDWIVYKTSTFTDPRDIGTPNQGRFTIGDPDPNKPDRESYPEGAYYLPGVKPYLWWEEGYSQPNDEHPFCKPGVRVASLILQGVVIFCEEAFKAPNAPMQAMEGQIRPGDRIDQTQYKNTLPQNWFRELFWYCWNKDDEALDDTKPYSWAKTIDIANTDSKKIMDTAQAYIFYATAMYWDSFYWGHGVAAKSPEMEKEKEKGKKFQGLKDKFKSIAGKKGQSSTNPNGRRIVKKRGNDDNTSHGEDDAGVQTPGDLGCENCEAEPNEANLDFNGNDTQDINIMA
ncbi:hypothetical protein PRZ48_014219 [Zasmidium cellare]|uniref:Uncharacterized protein n=1 Tax=Zasmidium cellare TaxID=395010 RepID=A0ABR0E127_ZASCE|nr:hypothetical protein PRZ48_014219 [Zasmidium cellare]